MGFLKSLFGGSDDESPAREAKFITGSQSTRLNAVDAEDVVEVLATDGTRPETRERLQRHRQWGVATPRIALTQTSLIDDEELIELVEQDIAELCQNLGFPNQPEITRFP